MNSYSGGSEAAFSLLYQRFGNRLFSFLSLRLGSARGHLIDELFQKTWLKVHLSRASFDPSRRFSAWLFTIALNCLRDEVGMAREKWRHESADEMDLVSESPSAEELFGSVEMMGRISKAVSILPHVQQDVVLLMDAQGFSSKEAAQILGFSDGAIRQSLSRARKTLRQLLSEGEFQ